jgi:hypothetical protein
MPTEPGRGRRNNRSGPRPMGEWRERGDRRILGLYCSVAGNTAMSRILRSALFAASVGALLLVSVGDAAAWYCVARSRTARGWGASFYLPEAKLIALRECAVRTPPNRMCRIVSCR